MAVMKSAMIPLGTTVPTSSTFSRALSYLLAITAHAASASLRSVRTTPAHIPQTRLRKWRSSRARDFPFPYLIDETQHVARAYTAACKPDLYLFGPDGRLVYRGQFDGSRPGSQMPVTGTDLRAAVNALLSHKPVPANQAPSVGCNIKWKSG